MVSKSGCVGWLKKRTNLEKTLLSLSSILLLTLLLMILIGITYHGKKAEATNRKDVCWSNECIKTSGNILSCMDSSKDICTDPYDFACGKYGQEPGETLSVSKRATESVYFSLKRTMELNDKLDIGSLEDVKSFYSSCVKFGSYRQDVLKTGEELKKLMTEVGIGIWPIIDPLYDDSLFSLELTLTNLILLDVPVVFQMEIVPDENLLGSYLIKISPGGPREKGRNPSEIRSDVHLRSSVLTSFLLLGASSAQTDANDVLSVDSSFAAIEQDKTTICDDVKMLAPQEAISEMNRLMPEINWDIVMREIRNATGLIRPLAVELHCKQKIRDYVVHLEDLSRRSETNYLGWRFFSKFAEHVIPTFEKSQFGIGEIVPRWRICLELMEKFASPTLAEIITKKMIDKEIQKEVRKISNSALTAAQSLVHRARWLTDKQKTRIRQKVASIRVRYPFQEIFDSGFMPISIPQVDVRNFTSVVIHRQRQWVIQKFRKLTQEADLTNMREYWAPLLTARSKFSSSDSTAYIYFDKIISPFMRIHGPNWLNYGGFGVYFAREISKILMSLNVAVGPEGNTTLWNIWSRSRNSTSCRSALLRKNDENLLFGETEELMKEIFLDYSSVEIAYKIASILTTSESQSIPGLEFTDEKMFFLSYAQALCEPDVSSSKNISVKEKLNRILLNFETFNKAFTCAPSSSRCQIWV